MEGPLEWRKKKAGMLSWRRVHAELSGDVLTLSSHQGQRRLAQISMRIAHFRLVPNKATEFEFTVFSGFKNEHFRSQSLEISRSWLHAMELAKNASVVEGKCIDNLRLKAHFDENKSNMEISQTLSECKMTHVDDKIAHICEMEARLSQLLSGLDQNNDAKQARKYSNNLRRLLLEFNHLLEKQWSDMLILEHYFSKSIAKGVKKRQAEETPVKLAIEDLMDEPSLLTDHKVDEK